jgi:hypothetical protein
MTIGIGLLCASGKYILLAADTRASYGTVTSNDQTAKSFDLPANYFGLVAVCAMGGTGYRNTTASVLGGGCSSGYRSGR